MLCKSLFIFFGILALAAAETYIAEDLFGSEYLLVPIPLSRQRRQTSVDIKKNTEGTQVTVGHRGKIFENNKHLVNVSARVSKQFRPKGSTTLGAQFDYEHKPSGSTINLNAANTRGYGTDVQATANANLWKKKNSRLDAYAYYRRHYGGPMGTGRPNYGGGIQLSHKF